MKKNNFLIFIIVILVILLAVCLVIIYQNNYLGTKTEVLSSGENVTSEESLKENATEVSNVAEENDVVEEITDEERQAVEEYITKVCDGNVKIYEFNDINEANKEWIYSHYPSEEDYDASAVSEEELESTLRKIFGTNLELNVKKDTENTDGYYIPKYNSQIGKYEYSPYGDTIRTDYIIDKITKNDNEYIVRLVEYSVQRDLERNADYDYAVFRYNEISNEFWKNWEKVFEIERGKTGEKEEIDNKILEQKDKFLSYNFVIEKNDIGSFNAIEFKKVSE
ncbi:MAG TPA: hypothetical protein IAD08_02950 [Candidatus Scatovivens faecipullorum]|nr:hypothetical protein [Candidatus Scatovivens faecipullorum]